MITDKQQMVLYMFQHKALPTAVFENHPELMCALNDSDPMPLSNIWAKAHLLCMEKGITDLSDMENYDADDKILNAISIKRRQQEGLTTHVIPMPSPSSAPQAYFIAIVHKDDEPHEYMRPSPSTRYYTLEKSQDSEQTFFCEWSPRGEHLNHGQGPPPELELFAKSVFDRALK